MHIRGEQPTECTVIHLALICCWGRRGWGGRLTEVGGTSSSSAFALRYLEFVFTYLKCAFYSFVCILHKTRFDHFFNWFHHGGCSRPVCGVGGGSGGVVTQI